MYDLPVSMMNAKKEVFRLQFHDRQSVTSHGKFCFACALYCAPCHGELLVWTYCSIQLYIIFETNLSHHTGWKSTVEYAFDGQFQKDHYHSNNFFVSGVNPWQFVLFRINKIPYIIFMFWSLQLWLWLVCHDLCQPQKRATNLQRCCGWHCFARYQWWLIMMESQRTLIINERKQWKRKHVINAWMVMLDLWLALCSRWLQWYHVVLWE